MSEVMPEVRVGDRERGEVDALLQAALSDGALDLSEYDERAARCWAARTRNELDLLLRDLPVGQLDAGPHVAAGPVHRVTAVLSESELASPVLPGQLVEATALMGTARVDLRREDLPAQVHVRAIAVMGEVRVQVPPGTTVRMTGGTVLGERKTKLGPPVAGGAVVHLNATAVLGTVKIDDRPRKGGLLPAAPTSLVRPGWRPPDARPAEPPSVRAGRARRLLVTAAGAAVPLVLAAGAVLLGAQVVSAADGATVFGSRTVQVDDRPVVDVGVVFGSVRVVVPDDARVRTAGTVVFGSVDCDDTCPTGTGDEVLVRGTGAFASIEIVAQKQLADD